MNDASNRRVDEDRSGRDAKSFKELGLSEGLQDTLDELGYEEPTPIQARRSRRCSAART